LKSYRHRLAKVEPPNHRAFLPPDDLEVVLSDEIESPQGLVRIVI
jgi:hypothetical protein